MFEALRLCRVHRAILSIARLDRLARNVALISRLVQSKVEFVAVDFPEANRLTIHILAAIADTKKMNSGRTKAASPAANARGKKFGGSITGTSHIHIKLALAASLLAREARVEARAMELAPAPQAISMQNRLQ